MNFNLNDVSSFSEEQLETLMNEIKKNPSIVVPHYLLKSQIMEYLPTQYKRHDTLNIVFDEVEDEYYLKLKNIIEGNLYLRIIDSIDYNLEDWLEEFEQED